MVEESSMDWLFSIMQLSLHRVILEVFITHGSLTTKRHHKHLCVFALNPEFKQKDRTLKFLHVHSKGHLCLSPAWAYFFIYFNSAHSFSFIALQTLLLVHHSQEKTEEGRCSFTMDTVMG